MTTGYRRVTIPASELRAAATPATDDPNYTGPAPVEEHTADLVLIHNEWRKVVLAPAPVTPGTANLAMFWVLDDECADGKQSIWRRSWEPVEVLRPESEPPFGVDELAHENGTRSWL